MVQDTAVFEVIKVTTVELQYLRLGGNWNACVGFMNGKGVGGVQAPTKVIDADFRAQTALIESGARNEWRSRGVPTWASAYGAGLAKLVATKLVARGVNLQNLDSDTQVSCEWTTELLTAISEKPAPVAAGLYRWLVAGAK
jgi:hypothetical protein